MIKFQNISRDSETLRDYHSDYYIRAFFDGEIERILRHLKNRHNGLTYLRFCYDL